MSKWMCPVVVYVYKWTPIWWLRIYTRSTNIVSHFSYSRDYILLGNFIVMVLLPFLVICVLNRKLYIYIRNNTSDAGLKLKRPLFSKYFQMKDLKEKEFVLTCAEWINETLSRFHRNTKFETLIQRQSKHLSSC